MDIMNFEIRGIAPLLMHSDKLANPLHPMTKELKKVTGKRKKTDEDHEALAQIEWKAGIYYDEKVGVYVPGENIARCIIDAAKMQKRGTDVKRGLMVEQDMIPLDYKGPRDLGSLYADKSFVDARTVKNQQSRVLRTRPIFREWGLTFSLLVDTEIFDPATIKHILDMAGRYIGLCDFRPRFGRFTVVGSA